MKRILGFLFVLSALLTACTDDDHMRRQLQVLQARNQADSLLTDLPLATSLCDYFDSHGSPNERMLAHYLLGRTHADRGEAPEALEAYHSAAECADTTASDCDYRLLAKIYGQCGELFFQQHIPQKANSFYDNAYSYALKAGDSLLATVAYEQKAKCYYHQNMPDKACCLLENAYQMYLSLGDTLSANTCLGPACYIYIQRGDLERAKEALDNYEYRSRLTPQAVAVYPKWQLLYIYKGEYFLSIANIDSALFCFHKELQLSHEANNRLLAYSGLSQIYSKLGIPDSAAKYAGLRAEYSDSNVNQTTADMLQVLQNSYDYSRHRQVAIQKEAETKIANRNFVLSCLAIIIIIITSVFLLYLRRKNTRMAIMRINAKYATDMIRYAALRRELENIRNEGCLDNNRTLKEEQELASISESIRKAHSDGKSPHEWKVQGNILDEDIVLKFHSKAAIGKTVSPLDWIELRKTVNNYLPDFMAAIASQTYKPNLKETEICILLKLRFILSEISILTQLRPSALTNKRQRLLKKMFNQEGSASVFDDTIQSL